MKNDRVSELEREIESESEKERKDGMEREGWEVI